MWQNSKMATGRGQFYFCFSKKKLIIIAGEATKKGYKYEQVCDKDLREKDYGSVDKGDPIHLRGRKKRRSLRPKRQKSLEHESGLQYNTLSNQYDCHCRQ